MLTNVEKFALKLLFNETSTVNLVNGTTKLLLGISIKNSKIPIPNMNVRTQYTDKQFVLGQYLILNIEATQLLAIFLDNEEARSLLIEQRTELLIAALKIIFKNFEDRRFNQLTNAFFIKLKENLLVSTAHYDVEKVKKHATNYIIYGAAQERLSLRTLRSKLQKNIDLCRFTYLFYELKMSEQSIKAALDRAKIFYLNIVDKYRESTKITSYSIEFFITAILVMTGYYFSGFPLHAIVVASAVALIMGYSQNAKERSLSDILVQKHLPSFDSIAEKVDLSFQLKLYGPSGSYLPVKKMTKQGKIFFLPQCLFFKILQDRSWQVLTNKDFSNDLPKEKLIDATTDRKGKDKSPDLPLYGLVYAIPTTDIMQRRRYIKKLVDKKDDDEAPQNNSNVNPVQSFLITDELREKGFLAVSDPHLGFFEFGKLREPIICLVGPKIIDGVWNEAFITPKGEHGGIKIIPNIKGKNHAEIKWENGQRVAFVQIEKKSVTVTQLVVYNYPPPKPKQESQIDKSVPVWRAYHHGMHY